MNASIRQALCPSLMAAVLAVANFAGCADDDSAAVSGKDQDAGESAAGSGSSKPSRSTDGSGGSKGGAGGSKAVGGSGGSTTGAGGAHAAHAGGQGGAQASQDADSGLSTEADGASKAADLRVALNLLLSEHMVLASKATGAALGGRMDELSAYGGLLDDNGKALGDMVGAAFGDAAKDSFNTIWSAHNGYFVDYTQGVAAKDQAKQDEAVNNLATKYVPDFAKLLAPATGLPQSAIEQLTLMHVNMTKDVVDAQAAQNWPKAYSSFRLAFAHMQMIGDALSDAIASKKSDLFPGDLKTKAVDLRVTLNEALQEHLYLATFATNAALRSDGAEEFAAAGAALNTNGTDIGNVIGSLYGDDAKSQFNGIWSAHNGYFVDYTKAVGAKDDDARKAAVDNLTNKYVPMFAAFLHGATDLPEDTLAQLTSEHVTTTAAVVDAQGAGKPADAAKADVHAGQHMQMLGDPLSKAIVVKLPGKF